ncbi:MAG TPA: hypothetical protein DCX06_01945 [Opitutae bacterium]|nr:hypothetical protein [Opitutae bacterium]
MIEIAHQNNIMKLTHILTLLAAALFFTGCGSTKTATSDTAEEQAAPATGSDSSARAKTAYEGSTGSGLLMERYKAGSIEGYRN